MEDTKPVDLLSALKDSIDKAKAARKQEALRCPECTALLAAATGVCTACGADPLGYYCDELDHSACGHTR